MITYLTDSLHLIHGENNGRFPYSNGLFICSDTCVLVDSGFGNIGRMEIKEQKIDVIINTHAHLDHFSGNRFYPDAEIWTHSLESNAISHNEEFMKASGLHEIEGEVTEYFAEGFVESKTDKQLEDGEILAFGKIALQVVHTPGHSAGHIALFEPRKRILFSGDIDLLPFGPFYGNRNGNINDFLASIDKIKGLNPKMVVTGHHKKVITDDIADRCDAYASIILQREEEILQLLSNPSTIGDLVQKRVIFKKALEPQPFYDYFEKTMLEKHLARLEDQGRIERNEAGFYTVSE